MPPIIMLNPFFWAEFIFSLIVVITCGLIYFRARELYSLSSYKGIKYFSYAFLFFGIAFLSRIILRIFAIVIFGFRNPFDFLFFNLGYLIFLYAGLMAGFYLIYSSLWKHLKNPEEIEWLFHPIAATIAAVFIIFLFGSETLIFLFLVFVISIILAYSSEKSSKERSKGNLGKLYILYILLFIAFIANALANFLIRISDEVSIVLYTISAVLFLIILYRVIKATKK